MPLESERKTYFLTGSNPPWCAERGLWPENDALGAVASCSGGRIQEGFERLRRGAARGAHAVELRLAEMHCLNARAWAAFLAGKPGDGLADAERVVAALPHHLNYLDTRGQICFALGRPDDALHDLDKAQRLGLASAILNTTRGAILEKQGRRDAAIEAYRKAASATAEKAEDKAAQERAKERLRALGADN